MSAQLLANFLPSSKGYPQQAVWTQEATASMLVDLACTWNTQP